MLACRLLAISTRMHALDKPILKCCRDAFSWAIILIYEVLSLRLLKPFAGAAVMTMSQKTGTGIWRCGAIVQHEMNLATTGGETHRTCKESIRQLDLFTRRALNGAL